MDSLENFRERFEALEQQTKAMEAHTRTIERRLRWWRGLACGLIVLGLLSLPLPSGKAQGPGLEHRVTALEDKLAAVTFDAATKVLTITGANLRIVNSLGTTDTTNGLGNLIVGYDEKRPENTTPDVRTGSHNIVMGKWNNFASHGGIITGLFSEIDAADASVIGGLDAVATGQGAVVIGGNNNFANGDASVAMGGDSNHTDGYAATTCGGAYNVAGGADASVSGGVFNQAIGQGSSVSGGANRSAPGQTNWAAGGLFQAN